MGVAGEIGENGPGSSEGALGVDDPLSSARSRADGSPPLVLPNGSARDRHLP